MKQGVICLDEIQVVVLDEADRMFDLGFIREKQDVIATDDTNRIDNTVRLTRCYFSDAFL